MPQTSPMNWIILNFILFSMYMLINQIMSNMHIMYCSQPKTKLNFLSKTYKW